MQAIKLNYRCKIFGREFFFKFTRMLPENWDDLTAFHLKVYAKLYNLKLKEQRFLDVLSLRCLNLMPWQLSGFNRAQMDDINNCLQFLFDPDIHTQKLILKKIKLPFYKMIFKSYYGPGKEWKNATVGEIAYADSYFQQYQTSENQDDLNKVIAAIYRPISIAGLFRYIFSGGDIRAKFNDRVAERRAVKFKALPTYMRDALRFQFIAYRGYVVKNNQQLYKVAEAATETNFGWMGIIHSMAGPELGTMDDIVNMLFDDALIILKKIEADRKQLEASFNKT